MKIIEKKAWPGLFGKIVSGSKTFDLRLNDFDIEEGDILFLREWDPKTKNYTGREIKKTVGFIGKWKIDDLAVFWSKKDIEEKGLLVISLK
jgi:hypothetical protein